MTELAAIERCSKSAVCVLSSGAVSLETFGQSLVSAGFMQNDALHSILYTQGTPETSKASKLMNIVSVQIKVDAKKFFKRFTNILKESSALQSVLDMIERECGKLFSSS